jgi:hypothetical protein
MYSQNRHSRSGELDTKHIYPGSGKFDGGGSPGHSAFKLSFHGCTPLAVSTPVGVWVLALLWCVCTRVWCVCTWVWCSCTWVWCSCTRIVQHRYGAMFCTVVVRGSCCTGAGRCTTVVQRCFAGSAGTVIHRTGCAIHRMRFASFFPFCYNEIR